MRKRSSAPSIAYHALRGQVTFAAWPRNSPLVVDAMDKGGTRAEAQRHQFVLVHGSLSSRPRKENGSADGTSLGNTRVMNSRLPACCCFAVRPRPSARPPAPELLEMTAAKRSSAPKAIAPACRCANARNRHALSCRQWVASPGNPWQRLPAHARRVQARPVVLR